MKRKVMLVALATTLMTLSATGGTLAYFSAQEKVTNAVTTGKVNITIVENFNPEDAKNLAPTNPANPKQITKEVRIQNQGGEAFVRVKFIKNWVTANEEKDWEVDETLSSENIELYFNEDSNWQKIGEYYYTKIDEAYGNRPSRSDVLLESFAFLAGENDERYKGKTAHIDVIAEAIQTRNQAIDAEWGITYDAETDTFTKLVETSGK